MTRLSIALVLVSLVVVPAVAAELETDEHKTLYALGLALSRQLKTFDFDPEEVAAINAGLVDGLSGNEPQVELESWGPKIDPYLQDRLAQATERETAAGLAFLEEMAAKPGAERTESGMIYFEGAAGEGDSPDASSTVRINYRGTFRDGEVFDKSDESGATFALNAVVPCFTEGLSRMKVGGKSTMVCPPELAYGDRGFPPMIAPGTTIVFEVELLEIVTPDAPAAPSEPEATP